MTLTIRMLLATKRVMDRIRRRSTYNLATESRERRKECKMKVVKEISSRIIYMGRRRWMKIMSVHKWEFREVKTVTLR